MTAPADSIQIEHVGAVAHVRLNRPSKHNAFDDQMATALAGAFENLSQATDLRVVVLSGNGPSFCAGGDVDWMRRVAD